MNSQTKLQWYFDPSEGPDAGDEYTTDTLRAPKGKEMRYFIRFLNGQWHLLCDVAGELYPLASNQMGDHLRIHPAIENRPKALPDDDIIKELMALASEHWGQVR